jgi:hypothetical protein
LALKGLDLALIWVRFFKIVNKDRQSLASFFQKMIFGKAPSNDDCWIPIEQACWHGGAGAEREPATRSDGLCPMAS